MQLLVIEYFLFHLYSLDVVDETIFNVIFTSFREECGVLRFSFLYICLSACTSQKQNFTKFSVEVTCGRGSVLTTIQYVTYFRFCGLRRVFI